MAECADRRKLRLTTLPDSNEGKPLGRLGSLKAFVRRFGAGSLMREQHVCLCKRRNRRVCRLRIELAAWVNGLAWQLPSLILARFNVGVQLRFHLRRCLLEGVFV